MQLKLDSDWCRQTCHSFWLWETRERRRDLGSGSQLLSFVCLLQWKAGEQSKGQRADWNPDASSTERLISYLIRLHGGCSGIGGDLGPQTSAGLGTAPDSPRLPCSIPPTPPQREQSLLRSRLYRTTALPLWRSAATGGDNQDKNDFSHIVAEQYDSHNDDSWWTSRSAAEEGRGSTCFSRNTWDSSTVKTLNWSTSFTQWDTQRQLHHSCHWDVSSH